MKQKITDWILEFIKSYREEKQIVTCWEEPLVGFADAKHPYIQTLPTLISKDHELPAQVLQDASIVIVYYLPFTKELAKTNQTGTLLASEQWARAYEETNAMFKALNQYLIQQLALAGYHAEIPAKMGTFNQTLLISDWSLRHFAYAAGLGSFGINNMLITPKGCCGRFSSLVTNLDVQPNQPVTKEYCLYKANGTCGVCVKNCPGKALQLDAYDRIRCYGVLKKNAEIYTDFGSSYTNESGTAANSIGSEVCGKCVTQSPCAFWR